MSQHLYQRPWSEFRHNNFINFGYYNVDYSYSNIFETCIEEVHNFHNRILNCTTIVFDNEELLLLGLGLKYAPFTRPSKNDFKSTSIYIENIIRSKAERERNLLRAQCADIISNTYKFYRNNNLETQNLLIKNLKSKILENDAICTKADKGSCLVVMYKKDYIEKTTNFIDNNNFIKINYTVVNKYASELKEVLGRYSDVDLYSKYHLLNMNPMIPL